MKKDLEWLKKQIVRERKKYHDMWLEEGENERDKSFMGFFQGKRDGFGEVLDLLDQLDEPEVLSSDWIKDNQLMWTSIHGAEYYVPANKLYGKIVPKQELPVIPKFVADWISEHHEEFDLYPALRRLEAGSTRDYDAYKWYRRNTHTFVNAYLTGKYEVEGEQKYYVVLEENSYGAMGLGIDSEGSLTFTATHDKWSLPKLTEREIKDYDERFWPFAVKVEEWEND